MQPQRNVPITKIISNKYVIFLENLLGQGSYGALYLGCLKENPNQKFAIKIISYKSKRNQKKPYEIQQLLREQETQRQIDSQFVVKMIDVAYDDIDCYIILEYCEQGNLAQLLKKQKNNRLPVDEAFKYFKHIVQGYKALYIKNIVHRDLKPENILFNKDIAKIADFGFSRIVDDMDQKQVLSLLGTPMYSSPEILRGQMYSSNTDIWSLGCIFFEMLYGFSPFQIIPCRSLVEQIQQQQKPIQFPQEPQIDTKLIQIIKEMLKQNPADRIRWDDLFVHPLIRFDTNQFQCKQQIMDEQTNSVIVFQIRQQNKIQQVSQQIDQFIQLEQERRDFQIKTMEQVINIYELLKQPKVNVFVLYLAVLKQLKLTSENFSNLVYGKINEHFNIQQLELYKQSDKYFDNRDKFKYHINLLDRYIVKYFPQIQKVCDRLKDQALIEKINKYKEYSENDDPEVGKTLYLQIIGFYLKDLIQCYQRNYYVKQNRQVIEFIISIYKLMEMGFMQFQPGINDFKEKLQQTPIAELISQIDAIYKSL